MSDFHQNGVISTLHNLSSRSLDEIERELRDYSKSAPSVPTREDCAY